MNIFILSVIFALLNRADVLDRITTEGFQKNKKKVKFRTFPIHGRGEGLPNSGHGDDYEGCGPGAMVMVMLVVIMLPLIIILLVGHQWSQERW